MKNSNNNNENFQNILIGPSEKKKYINYPTTDTCLTICNLLL